MPSRGVRGDEPRRGSWGPDEGPEEDLRRVSIRKMIISVPRNSGNIKDQLLPPSPLSGFGSPYHPIFLSLALSPARNSCREPQVDVWTCSYLLHMCTCAICRKLECRYIENWISCSLVVIVTPWMGIVGWNQLHIVRCFDHRGRRKTITFRTIVKRHSWRILGSHSVRLSFYDEEYYNFKLNNFAQ